jgi:hypothetical protein
VKQFAIGFLRDSQGQLGALARHSYTRNGRGAVSVTVPGPRPQSADFREFKIGYRPLADLYRRVRRAELSDADRAGAEGMIRLIERYDPETEMVVTVGCGPRFLRTTLVVPLDAPVVLTGADGVH